MLFEDLTLKDMALKEISVTFKCDEEFRDWLYGEAGKMDLSVSAAMRSAALLAFPQMRRIRGIARIQLEDMRNEQEGR